MINFIIFSSIGWALILTGRAYITYDRTSQYDSLTPNYILTNNRKFIFFLHFIWPLILLHTCRQMKMYGGRYIKLFIIFAVTYAFSFAFFFFGMSLLRSYIDPLYSGFLLYCVGAFLMIFIVISIFPSRDKIYC